LTISDGLALAMLLSLLLLAIGFKMRSRPVVFVSSLGWLISSLKVYQELQDPLPMALLMMVAFAQVFVFSPRGDSIRWVRCNSLI